MSRELALGGVLSSVILSLDLGWRSMPQCGVQPRVVEPVDPGQGRQLKAGGALPRSFAVSKFGLVQPDNALREGVEAPMSSGLVTGLLVVQRRPDDAERFSDDVAFEDAQGVLAAVALLSPSFGELAGPVVVDHAVVAMVQRALLAWRSPSRLSRWRCR